MDYNAAALEMHAKYPGKLIVNSLFEVKDRDALSTAYTPGVAEPCRQIKANPDDVYKYTFKGRTVAVVTNGTAVLGLGNIGAGAGLPVMEGKCALFKAFGDVDAIPLCVRSKEVDDIVNTVRLLAGSFGAGLAFRFVGQVDIFKSGGIPGGIDALPQLRRQFALLADGAENGLFAFGEF